MPSVTWNSSGLIQQQQTLTEGMTPLHDINQNAVAFGLCSATTPTANFRTKRIHTGQHPLSGFEEVDGMAMEKRFRFGLPPNDSVVNQTPPPQSFIDAYRRQQTRRSVGEYDVGQPAEVIEQKYEYHCADYYGYPAQSTDTSGGGDVDMMDDGAACNNNNNSVTPPPSMVVDDSDNNKRSGSGGATFNRFYWEGNYSPRQMTANGGGGYCRPRAIGVVDAGDRDQCSMLPYSSEYY